MAYNFPKDGIYSIKQAQKRLELSDDDLEQCLANSWLCLALPKSVITGATVGHFAALPFDQEENLPAEHQGLIAALRPLPDYLYNVGEHGPTEAVVFNDFSQNSFLLTAVRRYTTSASADDTEVKSPLSGYGELDTNAKTKTLADPVTLWHLAQAMCGKEYGFDSDAVIEGEMVVSGEEIERFKQKYGADSPLKVQTLEPVIFKEEGAEEMKPHQKATAARTKEKERRQLAVKGVMDTTTSELSAKEYAKQIHAAILGDPSKYGLEKAPAVSTIQNDITEIKKRRSK